MHRTRCVGPRRASTRPQVLAQELYERLQLHRDLSPPRIIQKHCGRARPPVRKGWISCVMTLGIDRADASR
jgi:hypothetical protein